MYKTLLRQAHQRLQGKFLGNGLWLVGDKLLRMGLSFLLNAWIARYLGTESFGLWNYALALMMMLSLFSTLGLYPVFIKAVVEFSERSGQIIGTALTLRFLGALLMLAGGLLWTNFDDTRPELLYLVAVIGIGYVFQALDIFDFYFQAQAKIKAIVQARSLAFVLTSIGKVYFLFAEGDLMHFVWLSSLELLLSGLFFVWIYQKSGFSLQQLRFNSNEARGLLQKSLPLAVADIGILIYMKIDQLMIGDMLNDAALGLYSAVVKLSELWYFLPNIVISVTYPSLIKYKKEQPEAYLPFLQRLYALLFWGAALIGFFVSIGADFLMLLLYGQDYRSASTVLTLHVWCCVFVFTGMLSGMWLNIENLQKYWMWQTFMGAGLNLLLNIWLIPTQGIWGAALATLLSQAFTSWFSYLLFGPTRPVFILLWKAISPVFLWKKVVHLKLKKNLDE